MNDKINLSEYSKHHLQDPPFSILFLPFEAIQHYLAAYALPISIVMNCFSTISSFYIFATLRSGIGAATKFLYISLTAIDLTANILYYGLNIFGDFGVSYLTTRNKDSYKITTFNNFTCKTLRGLGYFALHSLNWIYVLINLERIIAVRFPLIRKKLFSLNKTKILIGFLLIFGIFSGLFAQHVYVLNPVKIFRPGLHCSVETANLYNWLSFRIFVAVDAYIGPNLLSLILSLYILMRIWKQLVRRSQLTNQQLPRGKLSKKESLILPCEFYSNS